jgi:type 1 fimbria pilin
MMSNRLSRLCRAIAGRSCAMLIFCAAALTGLMLAPPAWADDPPPVFCDMSASVDAINFGTVDLSASSSLPNGSPIGSSIVSVVHVHCPKKFTTTQGFRGFYLQFRGTLTGSNAGWNQIYGTFRTGIAGIGLRVISTKYNNRSLAIKVVAGSSGSDFGTFAPDVDGSKDFSADYPLVFQLIKTGTIDTGGKFSSTIFSLTSHDVASDASGPNEVTFTLGGNASTPTCGVKEVAPFPVILPTVMAKALPAVNATAGETAFSITLDCSARIGSKLFVSMADVTTPGNTTDKLTLTPITTVISSGGKDVTVRIEATGVKLQILYNHHAILFGPEVSTVDPLHPKPNQWQVGAGAIASPVVIIPLTARYVATGPVTPGPVAGYASFTLAYQ